MTLLLVAIVAAAFGCGDVALTAGMRQAGEARSFRPLDLAALLGRAFGSPAFLLGLALQGLALVAYLAALARADLSLVFPLTATSTVLTTLLAGPFLGERVGPRRWTGVAVITLGVILISMA